MKHVAIVGGGFAGLAAARELRRADVRVTLVDRRNHHLFQPLLYQVATAALNPGDIAAPIRRVLRHQENASVILADVTGVDLAQRKLVLHDLLHDHDLAYDFLIVATGARESYFGHDDWERHAPGLKTIEDALEMRRKILLAYEAAEREEDPTEHSRWLTFVVVGGGPTGVELAGALAEISRHALARDFRRIDPRQARIILIEGLDRVLPTMPAPLSEKAKQQLERLGVEVQTSRRVMDVDAEGVTVDGERIEARTILWAAGVAASPLGRALGAPVDKAGRVRVSPDLSVPGHPEVFVAGDLAFFEQDGAPVPGVAPAAMQQGRHAAQNIVQTLRGEATTAFRYRDKGMMATIGRGAGVADVGGLRFSGLLAWLAWLTVHIFFLIGFRNRFLVLTQWAWAYLTWDRGARLITGSPGDESAPM